MGETEGNDQVSKVFVCILCEFACLIFTAYKVYSPLMLKIKELFLDCEATQNRLSSPNTDTKVIMRMLFLWVKATPWKTALLSYINFNVNYFGGSF